MTLSRKSYFMLFCLLLGGAVSVALGQDSNYDLRNYHLYNAFALLHGRLHKDFFAAGIQTYFAPLLDVPYYLLSTRWLPDSPRTVSFIMGLPYGLVIYFVYFISSIFFSSIEKRAYLIIASSTVATVFGVTGAATLSQVGTTFNEIPIAALVLGAIALLLRNAEEVNNHKSAAVILSGSLFGAAAALKLTAAIYAPAAVLAIYFSSLGARSGIRAALYFCLGWWVAFLALWGWWGWRIYDFSGSPTFPLLNSVFHSTWIPVSGGMDERFKPKSVVQALFYPFFWASKGKDTVAETGFSDPRFAVAFVAYFGIIAFLIADRFFARNGPHEREFRKISAVKFSMELRFLLIFILLSYITWEAMFSILRYAVVIESLLGIFVVYFALRFSSLFSAKYAPVGAALTLIFSSFFFIYKTDYPKWGRVAYSGSVFQVPRVTLPENSLVLLFSKPVAFIAPFIAGGNRGASFFGLTPTVIELRNYPLGRIVFEKIRNYEGPIYIVLFHGDMARARKLLYEYDISLSSNCALMKTNMDPELYICQLFKGMAPTSAKAYKAGAIN